MPERTNSIPDDVLAQVAAIIATALRRATDGDPEKIERPQRREMAGDQP